ncbi:hypothetical protein [Franconibacter helveticus]|nr:hypothetical protein [Franconibacter helveticus]GGD13424.1 hypothetical protein GCM10011513_08620 [Franconibacter daqui]
MPKYVGVISIGTFENATGGASYKPSQLIRSRKLTKARNANTKDAFDL